LEIESGDRQVIGVNAQVEQEASPRVEQPDYGALEAQQVQGLRALKAKRDGAAAVAALQVVRHAARGTANLVPSLVDAVKARVTLGEISHALREEWGTFDA
jgi:methylmalonyl-CoA mutase N-terminal domain/subunit